jgi:hypothetical protein
MARTATPVSGASATNSKGPVKQHVAKHCVRDTKRPSGALLNIARGASTKSIPPSVSPIQIEGVSMKSDNKNIPSSGKGRRAGLQKVYEANRQVFNLSQLVS